MGLQIEYAITKGGAAAKLKVRGFTEVVTTSESGDHGPGSRVYYCRPGTALNAFGWPVDTANISKVGRRWAAAWSE